jgi:long-subunit fatty acid transport protein
MLSFGTSMQITPALAMHLAYTHGFENELNDSIQTAAGAVPGSSLTQKVSAHFLTAGFSASF